MDYSEKAKYLLETPPPITDKIQEVVSFTYFSTSPYGDGIFLNSIKNELDKIQVIKIHEVTMDGSLVLVTFYDFIEEKNKSHYCVII